MDNLKNIFRFIDGKGYKAYKEIEGIYDFNDYTLIVDHVQGDPFASPSRIRVRVHIGKAKIPYELYDNKHKKIALCDFVSRNFYSNISRLYERAKGSGKSGVLYIDKCGEEVLERTSIYIDKNIIEARLEVGLPAAGRKILSREAYDIFFNQLKIIVNKSLYYDNLDKNSLKKAVELSEDQYFIRNYIKDNNFVAFLANDSILPRESGVCDKPLKKAVKFKSPETMEITIEVPNKGKIKGMAIKEGITLMIGGGYHGKSTLLKAIERGIYNHVLGDGREYVITRDDAVKVRSEDGRYIEKVDISPFVNNLPNKEDTSTFSTLNASGSTSQAASVIETIDNGSKLLLIDEDTAATNFMVRDEKMKYIVEDNKEPIIPFINRVKSLYDKNNISTILVVGSSGEYFNVADKVIMLDEYNVIDVTDKAIRLRDADFNTIEEKLIIKNSRILLKTSFPNGYKGVKVKTLSLNKLLYNDCEIDLQGIEQLVDISQTRAIGEIIKFIKAHMCNDISSLRDSVYKIYELIDEKGLDSIVATRGSIGNLALPRKYEVLAVLNRFRCLKIK